MRIITFACVIAVHTISRTVTDDVPVYALLALLHFTREAFFALSAFVLVYTSLDRHGRSLRAFTRRRFVLVLVPYVVWSAIYVAFGYVQDPHGSAASILIRFGWDLLTGMAWYHLYFLLVSLQLYLLLPVILWFVRRTRGHHLGALIASGALQLVLTGLYMYDPSVLGPLSLAKTGVFVSYQFFILLGAVAADHAEELLAAVRHRRRSIAVGVGVTAAITVGWYLLAVALGESPTKAATPLQPVLMLWSVAASAGLLALGTLWADRRRPGLLAETVRVGSDRSFGIFLAHPLVIALLLLADDGWLGEHLATPWPLTVVVYLLTIAGTVALVEVARRSILSLPLTGRPFRAATRPGPR